MKLVATVLLLFCVSDVLADSGSRARAVLALAKAKEKEKAATFAPAPVVTDAGHRPIATSPTTQEPAPVQYYYYPQYSYPQYDRPRLFNGGFFFRQGQSSQSSQCPSGR